MNRTHFIYIIIVLFKVLYIENGYLLLKIKVHIIYTYIYLYMYTVKSITKLTTSQHFSFQNSTVIKIIFYKIE
jgi:hypothetical protein